MAHKIKTEKIASKILNETNSEYSLVGEYSGAHSKIKIQHRICGNIQEVRLDHFMNGTRCPICKTPRKTNEEFLDEVNKLVDDEYTFLEEYTMNKTPIKVRHNVCQHIYKVRPANFLTGKRCPKCAKNMPLNTESFKHRVFNLVGNEYEVIDEYVNSQTKITMRHSLCGNKINITPSSFLSGNRCSFCRGGVKFHTTNTFSSLVSTVTNSEYSLLGEYKNARRKTLIRHNKCEKVYSVTPGDFTTGTRCPFCFGNLKKTTEEFIREVYNLTKDEYKVLSQYVNNNTKIKIRHNTCNHTYFVAPADFLGSKNRDGRRCPNCFKNEKKTNESFQEELHSMYGDKFEVIGEYTGANNKIEILHSICGLTFHPTPSNILRGVSGCPCESESKGEIKIRNYLLMHNCEFISQYSDSDCKYKIPLRFDFAIVNQINTPLCLIEFDGKQHFEPIDYFGGEKAFKLNQKRDKIKTDYCLTNNIPLIRIPYWDFDRIEEILDGGLSKLGMLYYKFIHL